MTGGTEQAVGSRGMQDRRSARCVTFRTAMIVTMTAKFTGTFVRGCFGIRQITAGVRRHIVHIEINQVLVVTAAVTVVTKRKHVRMLQGKYI